MMVALKDCPKCGAEIQASAKVYFSNVQLNAAGEIVSLEFDSTNDQLGDHPVALESEFTLYCSDDCDLSDVWSGFAPAMPIVMQATRPFPPETVDTEPTPQMIAQRIADELNDTPWDQVDIDQVLDNHGFDRGSISTEEGLSPDDEDNDVIDFCNGAYIQRHAGDTWKVHTY